MTVPEYVGVALLVCSGVLGWLIFRRLRLLSRGGVDVMLRRVRSSAPHSTRGWNVGVLRYHDDDVSWFRVISLRGGPEVSLNRRELEIVNRRAPGTAEEQVLPPDATVLRCRVGARTVELGMSPDVLTGFLSWLEATPAVSPPITRPGVASRPRRGAISRRRRGWRSGRG